MGAVVQARFWLESFLVRIEHQQTAPVQIAQRLETRARRDLLFELLVGSSYYAGRN